MYIKINETLYPATVKGRVADSEWDGRASKAITLGMTYDEANKILVDGVVWSIVEQNKVPTYAEDGVYARDENGELVYETVQTEYDNSEFYIRGDLTVHTDGTCTVKMGKPTDLEEAYELLYGGM